MFMYLFNFDTFGIYLILAPLVFRVFIYLMLAPLVFIYLIWAPLVFHIN